MTERATETHNPELREERKVVTALFADLVGDESSPRFNDGRQ